ncbi:MAG: phosphatase PAP2 family protein [Solirubrobacterales bacterium]|nr:phosphatase PAP2 family protein [Solirubrobacterales bacterium]
MVALYLAVVRTYWGQRLDEHALVGRALVEGRPSAGADDLLSAISVGSLVLAVLALVLLAIVQRKPAAALLAFVVVAGSLLLTELLKQELLTRPLLVPSVVLDNSYPSGHTTIGIGVGLAMVLVAPARLRIPAAIGGTVLAAAVGIATVAAGWHRPSDAVAAYLVALAVAATATAAMLRFAPAGAPSADATWTHDVITSLRENRSGPAELTLGAMVLLGAALFGLALLRSGSGTWNTAGVGFLLSAAAIAASAAAVVVALLLALSRIEPSERA